MSLKPHLTRQVVVLSSILLALALVGYAESALGLALLILLIALIYLSLIARIDDLSSCLGIGRRSTGTF